MHYQGADARQNAETSPGMPKRRQANDDDEADPDELIRAHLEVAALASAERERQIEIRNAQLAETLARLAEAKELNRALSLELEEARTCVAIAERERTAEHNRRMEIRERVRQIYTEPLGGTAYGLILRTCLILLEGTRGLYVTLRGADDRPRIRAASNVDGYPDSPPSAFLINICRRALESDSAFICTSPDDVAGLGEPERPGERFRNFVAAPVVLLNDVSGVILIADKEKGDFSVADVETLLSVGGQAATAVKNVQLQHELERMYHTTITILADAVEAKDPYTAGHSEMVCRYARWTAKRLGLTVRERSLVAYAALLHDVGKIAVSDGILHKPGPLLPEEREVVRAHVRIGHDLIARIPALSDVAEAVLHHHERWDGTGYPKGLRGDDIPLAARIVSVVDAFGAMVSHRSYKDAYPLEMARDELSRCAGTQFDPRVVEVFLEVLDTPEAERDELDGDDEYDVAVHPDYRRERGV